MPGECDHPFFLGPFLVVHVRIADDLIGQVRLSLLGDQPDLELSNRHSGMGAVHVGVHARAGLELENVSLTAYGPDARESSVQVLHDGLGAVLQEPLEAVRLSQGDPNIRRQRGQTCPFFDQLFGLLPFCDVPVKRRGVSQEVCSRRPGTRPLELPHPCTKE